MANLETHYSARDIEARIPAALRAAGLSPEERVAPEQLGALDHFHTGGLRASRELLELAQIRVEDRVLDMGAGLAGPARMLASTLGCRVCCLEMSPDFCAGAVLLNRLTDSTSRRWPPERRRRPTFPFRGPLPCNQAQQTWRGNK